MEAPAEDLGLTALPRLSVKAAYFLSDLTPDAGLTMFAPGSHAAGGPVTVPAGAIDPADAVTPDIGPCDAVLFEHRTWHAAGLNTSGRTRLGAFLQYGYRWLAPVDGPATEVLAREDLDDSTRHLLTSSFRC